jgi:hypothetical protein
MASDGEEIDQQHDQEQENALDGDVQHDQEPPFYEENA